MARTCSACSRQQCGVPTAPTSNSLRTRGPTQMTTLAGHGAGAGYLIFMLRGWAAPMPIRWRHRRHAHRTRSTARVPPSAPPRIWALLSGPRKAQQLRSASATRVACHGRGWSAAHDGGERVEPRKNGVAAFGGEAEDRAFDAGGGEGVDGRLLRWGEEDRDGRGLRIAARLLEALAELGDLLDRVRLRAHDRHPPVAVLHDAIERRRAVAADDDRRVRLLDWLRIGPDLVEVHELAVKLGLAVGPDLLHRQHALAQEPPAALPLGAVIGHFFLVPSAADAEEHPAAREPVERRDFLGHRDRIALDDEADAGAELEP